MKKHKNLSIFIPHQGCPNQCSFCDQKKISSTSEIPDAEYVKKICDEFLPQENGQDYEIAFFGGSFTAIDRDYMISLLQSAQQFIQNNRAYGIRISTRPDAIDEEVLTILKKYGVTSIELGAQSMQDEVLKANLRGHTVQDVYNASKLIKEFGFSLGLQMMTGLYAQKNYMQDAVDTASQFIKIKPDTVRIYPTITLKNTLLETLYNDGEYTPPTLTETVEIAAKVSLMFEEENIKIIKLGLHAQEDVENGMVAGPYHQAFRELVEGKKFLDKFLQDLKDKPKGRYTIYVQDRKLSQARGQKSTNIHYLKELGYIVTVKALDVKDFMIKMEE